MESDPAKQQSDDRPYQDDLTLEANDAIDSNLTWPATVSPTWLHWTSLFFDILSHSRTYLIPAIIALLSAARGNSYGVVFAGLFFFPSLVLSVFRYFTLRYSISNRQLVVAQGLVFRSVRTVPIARIQNVDLVQNLLHRLFRVAEVRIETASGIEPEAILRVLSLQQVEVLRGEIFGTKGNDEVNALTSADFAINDEKKILNQREAELLGVGSSATPLSGGLKRDTIERDTIDRNPPRETLVQIPLSWLVNAGLASNRGMIMVGIGLGLLYQFDYFDRDIFRSIQDLIPKNLDRFMMVIFGLAAFVGLLVALRILGVGWYILRFYGYRLIKRGEDLQISCGLFTKVSASVPRNRIQLISIHRNIILQWMGFSSIRIETAGSSANQEDASQTVSRRWFLPVIPEADQERILTYLRPGFKWQLDACQWTFVAPRALARSLRMSLVISMIVSAIGYYFFPLWGGSSGIGLFLFLWVTSYLDFRTMRYARLQDGIVYQSGYINRKTTFTFFDRLQSIRVHQSPFDRRWKMAQLTIDTAGAGPAEHPLTISSLESGFAIQEQEILKRLAANHPPNFA